MTAHHAIGAALRAALEAATGKSPGYSAGLLGTNRQHLYMVKANGASVALAARWVESFNASRPEGTPSINLRVDLEQRLVTWTAGDHSGVTHWEAST